MWKGGGDLAGAGGVEAVEEPERQGANTLDSSSEHVGATSRRLCGDKHFLELLPTLLHCHVKPHRVGAVLHVRDAAVLGNEVLGDFLRLFLLGSADHAVKLLCVAVCRSICACGRRSLCCGYCAT